MHSGREFLDNIILLGAIQGFIVSSLLFYTAKRKYANGPLAVLIFLIALASLNLYLFNEDLIGSSKLLIIISDFIPLVIVMPFGPLIFFYVRSCQDPDFIITRKHVRHFYAVIIDLVPQIVALIYVAGAAIGMIRKNGAAWGNFIDTYNVYADIPRWISITGYLWLSLRFISSGQINKKTIPNKRVNNLKWLRQFIYVFLVFQAIWLLYLIPYVIPRYSDILLNSVGWYPVYIPLTVLIYWLGIKGLLIDQHFDRKQGMNTPASPETADQARLLLIKSMTEDHLYLQPALSLHALARHTGLSQKTISAVVNQHMRKTFNEFVNYYRVDAFKEKVRQPEMDHLTIAGIALECGFNSQATFQRTFKQFTGCSPSEYRKAHPDRQQIPVPEQPNTAQNRI
jgi:AraC-like DNA-binding protein